MKTKLLFILFLLYFGNTIIFSQKTYTSRKQQKIDVKKRNHSSKNTTDDICISDSLQVIIPSSQKIFEAITRSYGNNSIQSPLFALGRDRVVYKSINNGDSWVTCKFPDNAYFTRAVNISFFSENLGLLIAYSDITKKSFLFKTIDGGDTWQEKFENDNRLFPINLSSDGTVYIGGANLKILKSVDFGENWSDVSPSFTPDNYDINDIKMLTPLLGVACGTRYSEAGSIICRTTDGGNTWSTEELQVEVSYQGGSNYFAKFYKIDVINENILFMYDYTGARAIIKSTDGGQTFTLLDNSSYVDLIYIIGDIHFISENEGFICGGSPSSSSDADKIFKTEDGGTTWVEKNAGGNAILQHLIFIDENKQIGFASSNTGKLLRTTDSGENWIEILPLDYNSEYYSLGIKTIENSETYYVYGNDLNDKGVLLKNNTVINLPIAYNETFRNTFNAIDENILFYHTSEHMYKSVDGGENWYVLESLDIYSQFYYMQILNEGNLIYGSVYKYGDTDGFKLIKSIDFGETWTVIATSQYYSYHYYDFGNELIGYRVSEGALYKTTDGGLTEQQLLYFGTYKPFIQFDHSNFRSLSLYNLYVFDENILFLSGNFGVIKKSIDGGVTWSQTDTGVPYRFGIKMFNESIGYAVGEYGTILKTEDGGSNWNQISTDFDDDLKSTNLGGIGFVADANSSSNYRLAITGSNGVNSGLVMLAKNCFNTQLNVSDFTNKQLKTYPNPVTNKLHIKLNTDLKVKEVIIYNILGKIVLQEKEKTTLTVSHLIEGVYLVKIITNKGVGIRKIIKK